MPTIRLNSIARKLPPDMQSAVRDAVAYDPPPSDESSARLAGAGSASGSSNQALPGKPITHTRSIERLID